ncbi:MAG: acetylglutamate kinase [Deltaproteobacteria bacterium]
MQDLVFKASILHEALPYIRRFRGRVFVVKYGGHAMIDPALRDSFARDITLMKLIGIHPIVVHGGGPQIDAMLAQMGVVSERIDGLRVTNDETMDVVEMVLAGRVNMEIVSLMCHHGARAVGLSGKDDAFLRCERLERVKTKSGREVDPGRVGRVGEVRTDVIDQLVQGGFIPVIAPIGIDAQGRSLNVNADTVAGAVAAATKAEKLLLMTDIEGVRDTSGAIASSMTAHAVKALIDEGTISGGMIPKVQSALDALSMGVAKCHVVDGRIQHAALLEVFTDKGIGTEILV